MFLEYLEDCALKSLEGKGIAYIIDTPFAMRYIMWVFVAHFLIYLIVKRKNFSIKIYLPYFLFALYFVLLCSFTILPIEFPSIYEPMINTNFSLEPLLYAFTDRTNLINIAGNIILFVPITILGTIAGIKIFDKLYTTLLFSLFVSLILEGIQYFELTHGYTLSAVVDIIDVLTNVLGGLLGWLLIKFYQKNHNSLLKSEKRKI